MAEPQSRFYTRPQRKRIHIRAEVQPDLAAWLTVHLVRCQRAIDRIRRTQTDDPAGDIASSPIYYQHARSYLLMMLDSLADSVGLDDLIQAQELVLSVAERVDAAEPGPPIGVDPGATRVD